MKHLFFTLIFIFSIAANATTIVTLTESGAVTGIENLDIGGTLYNVDFESLNDTFSTHGGEENFWFDYQSAMTATQAINDELGLLGITSVNNLMPTTFGVFHPENDQIIGAYKSGIWRAVTGLSVGQSNYSASSNYIGTAWSTAEVAAPAPVPVPAAAWLFGHALIGLAGIKRMRAGSV